MDIFKVIHLLCYIIALIPSLYVSFSIDYTKFIKAKSNLTYFASAIVFGLSFTFLIAEFIYNITTKKGKKYV